MTSPIASGPLGTPPGGTGSEVRDQFKGRSVLVIAPTNGMGGAEAHLIRVLEALRQHQGTVHLACPVVTDTLPLLARAKDLGVEVQPIEFLDPGATKREAVASIVSGYRIVRMLINCTRPDSVLVHLASPNRGLGEMLATVRTKIPLVVVFQYVGADFSVGALRRPLYRLAHRGRVTWIAVSDANRRTLAKVIPGASGVLVTVPNGVDTPPDDVGHELRRRARQEVAASLKLRPDMKLIVSVGRLTEQKGYRYVLPAAQALASRYPEVRFLWLGAGPDELLLREEIRAHGLDDVVLLLGHRDDVTKYLRAADLYLMPSLGEGLPFALLEAMAVGTPAAVSRCDVLTEVISSPEFGWTFDVTRPASLAAAVEEALGDPERAARVGQRGRDLVRSNYTSQQMLASTLSYVAGATRMMGLRRNPQERPVGRERWGGATRRRHDRRLG